MHEGGGTFDLLKHKAAPRQQVEGVRATGEMHYLRSRRSRNLTNALGAPGRWIYHTPPILQEPGSLPKANPTVSHCGNGALDPLVFHTFSHFHLFPLIDES